MIDTIDLERTALLMIGYQRDWFDEDGVLHSVIEETARINGTLQHTSDLLEGIQDSPITIISTPFCFSDTYNELENPIGILKIIRDTEAFKPGATGSEIIDLVAGYGDRVIEIPGRQGFDAFNNTELLQTLAERNIDRIIFAGTVTSVCVNATALRAFEEGFEVMMLSDCTFGRTVVEQEMFCNEIFPLFTEVLDHHALLGRLGVPA